jgi:hypothetical protein
LTIERARRKKNFFTKQPEGKQQSNAATMSQAADSLKIAMDEFNKSMHSLLVETRKSHKFLFRMSIMMMPTFLF